MPQLLPHHQPPPFLFPDQLIFKAWHFISAVKPIILIHAPRVWPSPDVTIDRPSDAIWAWTQGPCAPGWVPALPLAHGAYLSWALVSSSVTQSWWWSFVDTKSHALCSTGIISPSLLNSFFLVTLPKPTSPSEKPWSCSEWLESEFEPKWSDPGGCPSPLSSAAPSLGRLWRGSRSCVLAHSNS